MMTSWPRWASSRAHASPSTPAPMIKVCTLVLAVTAAAVVVVVVRGVVMLVVLGRNHLYFV